MFFKAYGEIGEDYIEGYHTIPVSEFNEGEVTKIENILLFVLITIECYTGFSLFIGKPYEVVLNDTYKSLTINSPFENIEETKIILIENGFLEWIEKD